MIIDKAPESQHQEKYKPSVAAETEALMEDTIEKVADVHDWMRDVRGNIHVIQEMKLMLSTVSTAQAVMAQSAESMADSLKKFELRYERMEDRYQALINRKQGDGQIPLRSHYLSLYTFMLPTVVMAIGVVIGVLYVTKYDISATLTSIKLDQHKTQEMLEDSKHKTEAKIEEKAK
jgi:hypothetical protein